MGIFNLKKKLAERLHRLSPIRSHYFDLGTNFFSFAINGFVYFFMTLSFTPAEVRNFAMNLKLLSPEKNFKTAV